VLEGPIQKVSYRDPHGEIEITAAGKRWLVTLAPISRMQQRGLTEANLKPGQTTTTIESKTNFFAAVPIGEIAFAECTPLHRGRSTMVWQTRITRGDGKLCALVTQTQLVLDRGK